jgi:CRP-like cAMP-binding protein
MPVSQISGLAQHAPSAEPRDEVDQPAHASAKLSRLAEQSIFGDLSAEDIERISRVTRTINAGKGTLLHVPGEVAEAIFLLESGKVELYRLGADCRKLVFDVVGPGSFFGDAACSERIAHACYAEAVEGALIRTMSREDVRRLMLAKPVVATRILEAGIQRLVAVTNRLEEVMFTVADARVAALLLRLAMRQGGQLTVNGYGHQDLADMLGVYRETVTHVLSELKMRGFIAVSRKRVVLLQPEHLRGIAGECQRGKSLL